MKKLLSLVLALVMLLSFTAVSSAEGRVDVEFWYGLGGATGEIIQNTIAEFNAMQDKYNIIGVTQGSYTETFQNIQAPIAAKNPPALAVLEYSQVSMLASKEYSVCVSKYLPDNVRFITCVFGQEKDGKVIEKGTMCKMARGEMVRYMAENRIKDPNRIKAFDRLDYRFDETRSNDKTFVFIQDTTGGCHDSVYFC